MSRFPLFSWLGNQTAGHVRSAASLCGGYRALALWLQALIAIMFGLAFSLLLTLVLIPILYYRWPGKAVRENYAQLSSGEVA